jgi:hypothetical protein
VFASGFLRAVSLIVGVVGVLAGVVAALVVGRNGHASNGLIVGISVAFGSLFYSALLWLITNTHDDVASVKQAVTDMRGMAAELMNDRRLPPPEPGTPWPGPGDDPTAWEQSAR